MKVSPAHLAQMRAAIEPLMTDEVKAAYRERRIPRADSVIDIDKRFRWDLYYAAARKVGGLPDSTNGYNMDHIDTALRHIVPALGT